MENTKNAEVIVRQIADLVAARGGRALLVGGCVRDRLLQKEREDYDLEVFGMPAEALEGLLRQRFSVIDVGKSFGVLKLMGHPIDVSLPRLETKTGRGHRGFAVHADPKLPLELAARRRDLTVNAIYEDPRTGEILDPMEGLVDLQQKQLRHCSERFAEDPLRVLRVMQFAARLDFSVHSSTIALSRSLDLAEIPRERIEQEWRKLLLKGVKPSRGLHFLADCEALRFFPELDCTRDVPQNPQWHPEGDVFVHTGHCLDHFATERAGDESDWVVGLGVLCHDLGKPATTQDFDGVWRSLGHSEAGEAPTRSFLARLTEEKEVIKTVVELVLGHLRPFELFRGKASDAAVRRLAARVNIKLLVRVARHDHAGRPPLPFDGDPASAWLLAKAQELQLANQRPKPLVLGRHLINLGQAPGPHFRKILDRCFEAQLDGRFSTIEDGIKYLRTLLP